MQNPFSWSLPLGRVFGIPVRMHIFFPLFILAILLRLGTNEKYETGLWFEGIIVLTILVVSVFLHELGHCIGARMVDGEAQEILMWPLGGLAFTELPHYWRAHLITALAGPAVNLILCLVSGLALVWGGYVPPFNPAWDPFRPALFHVADETWYGAPKYGTGDALTFRQPGGDRAPVPDSTEFVPTPGSKQYHRATKPTEAYEAVKLSRKELVRNPTSFEVTHKDAPSVACRPFEMTGWQTFISRVFFVNWALSLLNLVLVGFPMDGGKILQAILWPRYGYRQAMLYAVFAGFIVSMLVMVWSAWVNDVFPLFLAMFILSMCWQQRVALEHGAEEGMFGYDFSQGYTSLERDQPQSPPRRKRPGLIKRWLQARTAKRMQRESIEREAEEQRMDELLEKVKRVGFPGLTDEERRFMKRVSDRYRNRNV